MKAAAVVVLALALVHGGADAKPKKKPSKDFWKVLVKPGAKWKLDNTTIDDPKYKNSILVETYDVRKVGDADVARIRWTHVQADGSKVDIGDTANGKPTQVAVTDKGLFLLNATNDDAKVAERLKEKPSRSTPPKAYEGNKKNGGRYLSISDDGVVCMGEAPRSPDQCEDTCDGWVCISETDGVTEVSGTMAPNLDHFASKPPKK